MPNPKERTVMGNRKPTNLPSKAETIAKYQTHEGDTGSPEVQIALLTDRIIHLTEHCSGQKLLPRRRIRYIYRWPVPQRCRSSVVFG